MNNGATEIISAEAAAENQQLNDAIEKVLLEHYAFAVSARNNLTGFLFLYDQLSDSFPNIHFMELARALYVRLASAQPDDRVSDAFKMGSLLANAFRNRPKPTYVEVEEKQDFRLPTGDTSVDNYIRDTMQREQSKT